jgi:hypothetical protein
MRYTPYTEAQIQSMNVMDEGIYSFQVLEVIVTDKHGRALQDKNGIDMAKIKLLVWDNDNRERFVYTFISGDGNFAYKLRHYAQTLGMVMEYEDGHFDILRTVGKNGKASIMIKKGTMKNDGSGEMWADRNDVKDFIVDTIPRAPLHDAPPEQQAAPQVSQTEELDDDVPF